MVSLSQFNIFDLTDRIIKTQRKLNAEGKYDEVLKLYDVYQTVSKLWHEMYDEAIEKEKEM